MLSFIRAIALCYSFYHNPLFIFNELSGIASKMGGNMSKVVMDLGDREQLMCLATLIKERKFFGEDGMPVEKIAFIIETKVKEVLEIA